MNHDSSFGDRLCLSWSCFKWGGDCLGHELIPARVACSSETAMDYLSCLCLSAGIKGMHHMVGYSYIYIHVSFCFVSEICSQVTRLALNSTCNQKL